MLTRSVFYVAAFVVASVAIVGYAVFNQLSFPVACGMMILFTGLLALASDVSAAERGQHSRSQMPSALSNHLQAPSSAVRGTLYDRETLSNVNDSNNSNCIRTESGVELYTFGVSAATLSARTSARGRTDPNTNSGSALTLPPGGEAERWNRVQLSGRVPFHTELRRPSLVASDRVAVNDSIRSPLRTTLTTPSRSGLWTDSRSRHQHVLPPFQRLTVDRSSPPTGAYEVRRSSAGNQAVYHPHYKALGILPQVRLAERDHLLLGQHNTRMLQDKLTVKVAPPDVVRQPVQLFVTSTTGGESSQLSSRSPATSGLRGKRKRLSSEHNEVATPLPSVAEQLAKRTRRQNSSSVRPAQNASVAAENPVTIADRSSLFDAMDVDTTNTSAATTRGPDVDPRYSSTQPANQQFKRQANANSNATEQDDDSKRSSKRRRQNSTNTESSASLMVPADRSPINASYSSMQRYRTRSQVSVTDDHGKSLPPPTTTRGRHHPYSLSSRSSLSGSTNSVAPRTSRRHNELSSAATSESAMSLPSTSPPLPHTSHVPDVASSVLNDGSSVASVGRSSVNSGGRRELGSQRRRLVPSLTQVAAHNTETVTRRTRVLTAEDLERDRRLELERVRWMTSAAEQDNAAVSTTTTATTTSAAAVAVATCASAGEVAKSTASLTSANRPSTSSVTAPTVLPTTSLTPAPPPVTVVPSATTSLSVSTGLSAPATSMPLMQSAGFQSTAFTAFQHSVSNPPVASSAVVTSLTVAVTAPLLSSSISTRSAAVAGSEFKSVFPSSSLTALPAGITSVPSVATATQGGFVFNPSKPAGSFAVPTALSSATTASLLQPVAGFRPISVTSSSSVLSFGINASQSVVRTTNVLSASGATLNSSVSLTTAAPNASSSAMNFTGNCVSTTTSSSWPSSLPAFQVSSTSVPSAFPVASLFNTQLNSTTPLSTFSATVPAQNLSLFRPNITSSNIPQFTPITVLRVLTPQRNNGVLGASQMNSFPARPDVINAATTATQPTFIFGQSQSSSTMFPMANHGASPAGGFGAAVSAANTASANPVFAFGNQSSAGPAPGIFGAASTFTTVAQSAFVAPFGGSNTQNAPSFGFPTPAVPSTFGFGVTPATSAPFGFGAATTQAQAPPIGFTFGSSIVQPAADMPFGTPPTQPPTMFSIGAGTPKQRTTARARRRVPNR